VRYARDELSCDDRSGSELILEHFKAVAAARGCDRWSLTCRIEPATIMRRAGSRQPSTGGSERTAPAVSHASRGEN
jgi:hypothetical protein